ncbi:MAG: chemotaxis protein CheW [Pleurocapsa sp.]
MSNLTVDLNQNTANKNNVLIKLLVFKIGKLTLALPILQVQKVVRQSEVCGSGLSHVSLTHLGEREIAVLDLHQKLFKVSLAKAQTQGYFIISQNVREEPLGILVSQAPGLIDVPVEQIRLVPDAYRRADTLEIASHVTVVTQGEETLTIFILDLAKLI